MQSMRTKIREIKRALTRRPHYLLVAAALLHISVAAAVLTVGKYQLMPAQFRANGVGEIASGSFPSQEEAATWLLKGKGPAPQDIWRRARFLTCRVGGR